MKLHTDILPKQQLQVFEALIEHEWLQNYYMVGGTALALQIGHRQSLDFDFFTKEVFRPSDIIPVLRSIGRFDLFDQTGDTLNGAVNDVQVSFFRYDYPLLKELHAHKNLQIAHMLDIALMKLEAIAGRGSKKDFVDLYFLLKHFSLSELFEKYPQKFGIEISNHYHLLKSLVYLKDAEMQPMPPMSAPISWDNIKKMIVAEVTRLQKEMGISS